ncbi:polyadenylate-binding protein, cytoplasmic and nuclear-like [Silurus meridionalis]|nr:polyadenylate-binding protein, cytoplasmic and nuclear-like [Silurus meridionalis]
MHNSVTPPQSSHMHNSFMPPLSSHMHNSVTPPQSSHMHNSVTPPLSSHMHNSFMPPLSSHMHNFVTPPQSSHMHNSVMPPQSSHMQPTWAEIVKCQKQPDNVQKIREEKTQIEKAEVQKKEEKQQLSENKKELQLWKSPKPVQDKSTEENKKEEQSEEVVEQNKQVAPSTLPTLEKPTWAEIVKRQKQPENVQKIREEKTQIEKAEVQKKEEKQQLSENNNKSSLSTDSKNRELYIWNLDYTVNNERLYNEFLPFGTIIHAKVIMKGLRSRGFGFVSFSSPAEAEEALKKMNGKILGKRTLYVSFSKAREGRETYRTQEKKMTESSSLSKPRQSPPGKTERVGRSVSHMLK